MSCETSACDPSCNGVFDRVRVDYLVDGGARISWQLREGFVDPLPHTFQLLASRVGTDDADDWEAVGAEVVNGTFAIDPDKRLYGSSTFLHYRVLLITSQGEYRSDSVPADCSWDTWGRQQVRQISRRFLLQCKQGHVPRGYLLKRRFYGPKCTFCLDAQTGEATRDDCPVCWGTRFLGGYHPPQSCVYIQKASPARRERLEDQTGTTNLQVIKGAMLNSPVLDSYDLWVNDRTDSRWLIHTITPTVSISGWPVIVDVELRKLEFSHPLYQLAIPEMIESRTNP